jgi:hypothetical protein
MEISGDIAVEASAGNNDENSMSISADVEPPPAPPKANPFKDCPCCNGERIICPCAESAKYDDDLSISVTYACSSIRCGLFYGRCALCIDFSRGNSIEDTDFFLRNARCEPIMCMRILDRYQQLKAAAL